MLNFLDYKHECWFSNSAHFLALAITWVCVVTVLGDRDVLRDS